MKYYKKWWNYYQTILKISEYHTNDTKHMVKKTYMLNYLTKQWKNTNNPLNIEYDTNAKLK